MSWPFIMSLRSKPLNSTYRPQSLLRLLQAARRASRARWLSLGETSMSLRSKPLNGIYRPQSLLCSACSSSAAVQDLIDQCVRFFVVLPQNVLNGKMLELAHQRSRAIIKIDQSRALHFVPALHLAHQKL
jgi:hypothetical protein